MTRAQQVWNAMHAPNATTESIAKVLIAPTGPSLDQIDRRLLDIDMLLMARNAGADPGDSVLSNYANGMLELGTDREIIARFPWATPDLEIVAAVEVWDGTLIF